MKAPDVVPFPATLARPAEAARARVPSRDYAYVAKEVRRIALLTVGVIVLLIILTVVLR